MAPSKILPALLLVIGGLFIATGGRGCDAIPWPTPPFVEPQRYPDAWLIFIEESEQRDIDFAILLQNKKWIDSLNARKINWRVYDKDQPDAKSYIEHCREYPWLLIVDKDGTLVKSVKAPVKQADAEKVVEEVIGK
jgi:hypothetical protein